MIYKNLPFRTIIAPLSSPICTVAALIVLSILVVWGTLYQVDHGIYAAQERFFRSWLILIAGIVPFPGVKSVVAVLSINLLAAAFKRRPITLRTIGVIILHCGVAVLIGGTAIAASLIQESAITLSEGMQTEESYDFSSWQLVAVIAGRRGADDPYTQTFSFDFNRLRERRAISLAPAQISITPKQLYRNCAARIDPNDSQSVAALQPRPVSAEQDRDFPGVQLSISAGNGEPDGRDVFLYAGIESPAVLAYGDDTVAVSLRPRVLPLPLRIELKKFDVQWHPGTSTARRFQSRVRVFGKNIDRDIVIEMNRPFRYRSFTFYQMGYTGGEGAYSSTLAVVKNPLRYMPYVASLIIVAGLFIHFFVKMTFELVRIRGERHAA